MGDSLDPVRIQELQDYHNPVHDVEKLVADYGPVFGDIVRLRTQTECSRGDQGTSCNPSRTAHTLKGITSGTTMLVGIPFVGLSRRDGRVMSSLRHREAGENAQPDFVRPTPSIRGWLVLVAQHPVRKTESNCVKHGHAWVFALPWFALGRQSPK